MGRASQPARPIHPRRRRRWAEPAVCLSHYCWLLCLLWLSVGEGEGESGAAAGPGVLAGAGGGYALDTVKLHGNGGARLLPTVHSSRKLHQLLPFASSAPGGLPASSSASAPSGAAGGAAVESGASPPPPRRMSLAKRADRYYPGAAAAGGDASTDLPLGAGFGEDEQSIIRGLFDSIDWRRQGSISRDQFLKAIRHDQRTRAWLRRTFLWSLYKARRWGVLLEMFEPDPSVRLRFHDFHAFLQRCQLETGVPDSQVGQPPPTHPPTASA